jgi:hypothetical protein
MNATYTWRACDVMGAPPHATPQNKRKLHGTARPRRRGRATRHMTKQMHGTTIPMGQEINQIEINKIEINQNELNQTEINQTDINQTDITQTEINQTDINQTDIAQTDINQTDFHQSVDSEAAKV